MRPSTLAAAAELAADKPHGTRVKYLGGCKCDACRAANSRYSVRRSQLALTGRGNPLVPSDAVRAHIHKLGRAGVGYKSVAEAARVTTSIVFGLRSGTRRHLRKASADRILAVTKDAVADAAVIPAGPTWRLIDELLEEGFTRSEIARRLGYRNAALQFRRDFILARNASKIERLYRTVMRGA